VGGAPMRLFPAVGRRPGSCPEKIRPRWAVLAWRDGGAREKVRLP
jgi:hypothetical protein